MEQSQQKTEVEAPLKVTAINLLGDGSSVLIATNRPAEYTSFTLTGPPRLVIDLPEADLYDVLETTKVNNKYLKSINVVTYGGKEKIGRIILELQEGINHDVTATDQGVLIRLGHGPLADAPEGAIDDGGVVVASSGDVVIGAKQPVAEAEPEDMAPATTVEELKSYTDEGETVIQIISDGAVGKYNTFELSEPARIVIDVWNVRNETGLKSLVVESDDIKDVRVGNHPDKVRFVIDLAGNDIPPYVVTGDGDHITVTFRSSTPDNGEEDLTEEDSVTPDGAAMDEAVAEDGGGEAAVVAEDGAGSVDEAGGESAVGLSNAAFEAGSGVATVVTAGAGSAEESTAIGGEGLSSGMGEVAADEGMDSGDEGAVVTAEDTSLDEGGALDESPTAEELAQEDTTSMEGAQAPSEVSKTQDRAAETDLSEGTSLETESRGPEVVAAVEGTTIAAGEDTTASDQDVSSVIEESGAEVEEALKAEKEAEEAAAAAVEEEAASTEETTSDESPIEAGTAALPEEAATPAREVAPVTEAVVETPAAPRAGNEVNDITFKKIDGKGFLTVKTSKSPAYTIKESSDHRTVVIDISDAEIRDELVRTLDASKLGTPVAAISSYQGSEEPPVTRILISLSSDASHSVMELDGTLNVIFTPTAKPVLAKVTASEGVVSEGLKTPRYTGKRIDLDMMDARITDILRLLAEVSNLNIIASDDVQGTISLRLRDVPWDQAFDIILKAKGLDKIRVGNVIRVAPAARIAQERDAALAAQKASEKLEPLSIEFVAINYAKAEELEGHVKNVLSDRGSVTSEKRTNTLIIKDIKKGIRAAKELVARLDTPIPQVLIEARIVEAASSFSRDLGIQWGVDYQTNGNVATDLFGSGVDSTGAPAPGQTPPSTTTTPVFKQRSGVQNFAVNLPATGSIGTLGALGFVLGKAGQNPLVLDLRLSAGEQEGQLRTISRPRVVTMDNKEAKIEDGESVPFETTSASGTSTIFVDANLSLTVTPHITPDGSVLMKIKASKNSIGSFTTSSGEPSIVKKEASTEVLVRDGETTVIGGIISSDSNHTDSGIPYLKDIPILGKFFRSKSTKESQKELLIFITPTIMKNKMRG